jgi:hypothetical protein
MNEKELRAKIRSELEKKHQSKKASSPEKKNEIHNEINSGPGTENKYLREAIIHSIEYDICSKFPEMVECENHLGDIKWLTPNELHSEYEYYPIEESWLQKLRVRLFGVPKLKIPDSEYWQKFAEESRQQIELDVRKRIELFKEKQAESQKVKKRDLEDRIYEEELDKFYGKEKGYKKYQNHLGEYRWLTKAEAEQQEEFFEEDPLISSEWIKRIAVLLFLVVIVGGWWIWKQSKVIVPPKAYLIVALNDDRGNLYIDKKLAAGFRANEPYLISAGPHQVSLIRNGFVSKPKLHEINAAEADTVRIKFDLEKKQSVNIGYVQIKTNNITGNVYIDDDFYGNLAEQSLFSIDAGEHSIRIERSDFYAFPYAKNINLSAGDTNRVYFELRRRNDTVTNEVATGLIEVRSNVKNADIYLNGKKTEYKTDYILQRMPFGQYSIALVKNGYKVYPEEKVIRIDKKESRTTADFTLTSTTKNAQIRTDPVAGEIFIDGKSAGVGEFKGSLPLGEHIISFGNVSNYKKPEDEKIKVTSDGENHHIFTYLVNYQIEFSPEGSKPAQMNGAINKGYFFNLPNFVVDSENGPEVRKNDLINSNIWILNFAFQYRNPPGSDAIRFTFDIPENIDLSQQLKLNIWGYSTSNNYPLAVRGNTVYQVIINNNTFQANVKPAHSIKNISENNFDSFIVNEYLKNGRNSILISTTNETSAEFALWKIRIE